MTDVLDRFLRYVRFDTQSNYASPSCPSTEKQKILAQSLVDELKQLGLSDAHMDQFGYVYAHLPASPSRIREPALGLIAHLDTSESAPGANVNPQVIHYQGGDLVLNQEQNIIMQPSVFPALKRYENQDLVVTDGTTLLGADDKAGIAEIVSAAEYLLTHPELEHGPVSIAFTPDEEVDRGTDNFDFGQFSATAAFTVDGGELGELNYENFNAASAEITIHGLNIHPGAAKNKMKNALLIACELVNLLPPAETPAHTEGHEGFYHLQQMSGDETTAHLSILIRDHSRNIFESRKLLMGSLAEFLNQRYGPGTVEIQITDSYYNMLEPMWANMMLIELARTAMKKAGVTPVEDPIRGGTDGARLTYMGLPCPNLSTGGFHYHGIYEAIPVQSLRKMTEVLVQLATLERDESFPQRFTPFSL